MCSSAFSRETPKVNVLIFVPSSWHSFLPSSTTIIQSERKKTKIQLSQRLPMLSTSWLSAGLYWKRRQSGWLFHNVCGPRAHEFPELSKRSGHIPDEMCWWVWVPEWVAPAKDFQLVCESARVCLLLLTLSVRPEEALGRGRWNRKLDPPRTDGWLRVLDGSST